MATKFEVQKGGPKWHLDIWNFTFFTGKMFFKFSLTSVGKIQKSRVFLKSSLLAVYRRPLEWLWDILLGREICSQSWVIIFQKSRKFQIFESQGNVLLIFYMKQFESDKIVSNFESQEVGPKWHFLSTILQIFTEKLFFKFSLNFAGKILKSRVVLKSSLLVVDRRPL